MDEGFGLLLFLSFEDFGGRYELVLGDIDGGIFIFHIVPLLNNNNAI